MTDLLHFYMLFLLIFFSFLSSTNIMAAVPTNTHEKAHIMLSYCDCDQLVTHVYQYLKEKLQVPIWLDKFDGKNASVTSR